MKLTSAQAKAFFKNIKFRKNLATAVVRDSRTHQILMVAHINREALKKTLTTGLMHYWSRERRKLWLKGEKSGHYQRVCDVWVDCDGDALLFDVMQVGAACHEGYYSCFHRKLKGGKLVKVGKRKFDPKEVYTS